MKKNGCWKTSVVCFRKRKVVQNKTPQRIESCWNGNVTSLRENNAVHCGKSGQTVSDQNHSLIHSLSHYSLYRVYQVVKYIGYK